MMRKNVDFFDNYEIISRSFVNRTMSLQFALNNLPHMQGEYIDYDIILQTCTIIDADPAYQNLYAALSEENRKVLVTLILTAANETAFNQRNKVVKTCEEIMRRHL